LRCDDDEILITALKWEFCESAKGRTLSFFFAWCARRENDGWFFPGPSAAASREEKSFKRIKQHPSQRHVLGRNFRRQNSFKTWLPRRPLRSIVHAPWAPSLAYTYTHYLHIPLEKSQGFIFHTSERSANNPITRARPTAALSYNGYIF
jgi:hypothetical protein